MSEVREGGNGGREKGKVVGYKMRVIQNYLKIPASIISVAAFSPYPIPYPTSRTLCCFSSWHNLTACVVRYLLAGKSVFCNVVRNKYKLKGDTTPLTKNVLCCSISKLYQHLLEK